MPELNFDQLIIDRPYDLWLEDKDNNLLAYSNEIQNFQISNTSETKDKTGADGSLLKRFYTAKNADVSWENVVFSMNFAAVQMGTAKKTGAQVVMPRILMVNKTDSPITLPDTPNDGTIMVYGTFENGMPDTDKKYVKDTTAGPGTYAVATDGEGVTTVTLPTDATDIVQIKYEYTVKEDEIAARIDQDGSTFPKECKATVRIFVSDKCDSETVRALYVVFPRLQLSPDFDWTADTESAQNVSGVALKDACARKKLLYYIAICDNSDEYDAVVTED